MILSPNNLFAEMV